MSVIVFNSCIRKLPASVGMALPAVPKMKQSLGRIGNASLPRLDGHKSYLSHLFDLSREITACS